MDRREEILAEIKRQIEVGGNVDISNLIREYCEIPVVKALGKISITGLNIARNCIVKLGDVDLILLLGIDSGQGKLSICDSKFKKQILLFCKQSFQGKRILFRMCTFEESVRLESIQVRNLSIFFIGDENKINLLASNCQIRNIIISHLNISSLQISSGALEAHFFGIRHSTITCNLIGELQGNSQLSALYIKNSSYKESFLVSNSQSVVPFGFIFFGVNFKDFRIDHNSVSILGKTLIRVLKIESNELHIAGVAFQKNVEINAGELNRVYIKGCNFSFDFGLMCNISMRGDFDTLKFKRDARFLFEKAKMVKISDTNFESDFYFENSVISDFEIMKCEFYRYASFKFSEFYLAPNFSNVGFTHSTTFHGAKFLDTKSKESEGRYRNLKEMMSKISNDSDEVLFSSYEIESRRKDLWKADKFEWFFSLLYSGANSYGRSVSKPFFWMFVVWLFFVVVFFFTDAVFVDTKKSDNVAITQLDKDIIESGVAQRIEPEISWTIRAATETKCYKAAVFSGINMLGPLRLVSFFEGFKVTAFRYVLVTWFQSILATILWYLFIVGIKRRFRTG
ncbi:hypothetical protein [Bdellovibrio sp. HCB-162]|uniref:hypothetical protein n=1 Tax=Bdellovibrio sp. HCB-162 TaxID=3394234 RepID=UPI0039BD8A5D